MDGHIRLSIGNVLVIGGVSLTAILALLAVTHKLSHMDVPVLSPTARGFADLWDGVTNKVAA